MTPPKGQGPPGDFGRGKRGGLRRGKMRLKRRKKGVLARRRERGIKNSNPEWKKRKTGVGFEGGGGVERG